MMQKNIAHPPVRFFDFWLLGGASLVAWVIFALAQYLRYDYPIVEIKMQQVAPAFAFMSLFINHPHFMASYRMAYGRGIPFVRQNWWPLIVVPTLLIALYAMAFMTSKTLLYNKTWVDSVNRIVAFSGLGYRLGENGDLGTDLLGISVWIMYLTVGWHYAKQVFGCAMVYSHYDRYPISPRQRLILKLGVFTVAFYSFCHLSLHWHNYSPYAQSYTFLGLPVTELGIPRFFEQAAEGLVFLGFVGILYGVIYKNYSLHKKMPSLNFLVPILAFYVWWIPLFSQREFYFILVPFFHSLQYLPFAHRIESAQIQEKKQSQWWYTWRLAILLLIGFLAFDGVPSVLDSFYKGGLGNAVFFSLAFAVFINIHHFFIDSVLWRFQDSRIQETLFSPHDLRQR